MSRRTSTTSIGRRTLTEIRSRDDVGASASDSIKGANPFIGLSTGQVVGAATRWAQRLIREPKVVARTLTRLTAEQVRVAAGTTTVSADPKDRRFNDPQWKGRVWSRVANSYLATRDAVMSSVAQLDLDDKSRDRARFALMQVTEALSPTNNLLTNPVAMRRALETRGASLARGVRHLAWDVRHNGGLPSQVDTRPFIVGQTLALTPGAVVYRSEIFELIQYSPTSPRVFRRPTVIVPPQVNKYYFLDLAPGRSFIEHAVAQGLQMFVISWRNPGPEQRDWSMDTYAKACLSAIETASEITGTDDVNVIGFCAGGITQSVLLSHLAAAGSGRVHAHTLAVTTIDTHAKSVMNMFVSDRSAAASIEDSERKGLLDGRSLARVFAWVRPNDLIWNYWVSNYLMGESPPAFDVLAWNSDSTNLPAALHADMVRLFVSNALLHPGTIDVLGTPVDLSRITSDLYVVAAMTDHLVPWEAAYGATHAFGGKKRFVVSNSGHIQALINPPGNPKASYFVADAYPTDPQDWLAGSTKHVGSWWTDWVAWSAQRSGARRQAPRKLGNTRHPPLDPAPGTYVHQR